MNREKLSRAVTGVVDLMERLRGPGGCPWDMEQTESTVKMYLIEEAYEVLDAIEKNSSKDVCLELGDLLFIIVFLSRIYEEKNHFDFVQVIERVTEKMIRRHPHIFGETTVNSSSDVSENWEKIKREEKGGTFKPSSLLEDVPTALPALLRAHRLSSKASKSGFDWSDKEGVLDKVEEEFSELKDAVDKNSAEGVSEEIGDLLFSLVNLARHWGLNSERLLREASNKFVRRFKAMEESLAKSGIDLGPDVREEMELAWNKIKHEAG